MRLFFYVDFWESAHAEELLSNQKVAAAFDPIGKMKADAEEKKAKRYEELFVFVSEMQVEPKVIEQADEKGNDEDVNEKVVDKANENVDNPQPVAAPQPTVQPSLTQAKKVEVFDPIDKLKMEAKEESDRQREELFLCTNDKAIDSSVINVPSGNMDKYRDLVAGHPMEDMVEFIAKRDSETASYLVAIAKKESDWGTHSPKKDGRNCFNYWGFKGAYNLTDSGYSCFDSPEQAIQVVGDKISSLIEKKIDTPERMVVWKCGSSCAGHDPAGVKKWITDVGNYHAKLSS
jgi:hypothetical protein